MRQHQPRRSRSHDADLRPHDPSPFCREHEHPNPFVQGMKGGIFGHFGRRGTGAKPATCGCGPPPLGLCWHKIKYSNFIPGETIMRRIPLLAGLSPFCIRTPADGRRAGADRRADRPSQLRRRRRDGRRAGQRQEGRLHHHHHRRQRQGRPLQLPAGRLEPGQYTLRIRAIGYDLDNHKSIEVAAQKTTTADLKLRKTEDLAAQMSNAEWINSIPGNDPRKGVLLNCVGCHTLERVMRSHAQRRGVHQDHAAAHAGLREPEHPAASAASQSRAADGGARRSRVQIYRVDGGVSGDRQSQLEVAVELSARIRCRGRAAAPRA